MEITANLEVARWLKDVANVRTQGELKERPIDRGQDERPAAVPRRGQPGTPPSHRVPMPVESLHHPLSVYDALVVPR